MPVFTGTSGPDTLTGTEGDDDFFPLGGNDTVNGLGGNDRMFGATNLGVDVFNGGAGYDAAYIDVLDYTGTLSLRHDTSSFSLYRPESGFGHGLLGATNTERLEIVLGGSNSRMTEFVVHFFSGPSSLDLVLDARANLNGITNRLSGNVPLNSLTILGTGFNDVITGGSAPGGDHLFGFDGADTLIGQGELVGGAGNDVYHLRGASTVVELAGEGIDTVWASGAFTLSANVENLVGSGGSSHTAQGRGNELANSISGFGHAFGMGGDDVLVGARLTGGAGDDRLEGVGASDMADYSTAAAGVFVTLDRAQPVATDDGDGGVDILIGIENLTGSAFNDVLIGNGAANVLTGGAGSDYLIGLDGNDVLTGGVGATNALQGGQGDDLYRVFVAGDTMTEFAGEGTDTVETSLSALTLRSNIEVLRFTGVGSFTGTGSADANLIVGRTGADTLIGMGGDDRLEGMEGADIFRGGSGNDEFVGGDGLDTADYGAVGSAVTVKLNTLTTTNDGEGGVDTFEGIENVIGSAFNDLLIGSGGANVLGGGAGRDYLIGLGGNDVLIGGGGAPNQMQGGAGNDRYILTAAGDTLTEFEGEGVDAVETTLSAYALRNNFENLTYTGTGAFTATGNSANNVLTGAAGADTFTGARGDDTLHGGGGVDTAVMSGVRDDYTIQAGADYITIGDSVVGRDGIDTLYGFERILFSDGEVLDVTPPAASLAAAEEALAGPQSKREDIFLTVSDFGNAWDSM